MRWVGLAEFASYWGGSLPKPQVPKKRDPQVNETYYGEVKVTGKWWPETWSKRAATWWYTPTEVKLFTRIHERRSDSEYVRQVQRADRVKFLKDLRQGIDPVAAARAQGKTFKAMMMDDKVRQEVEKLVREYEFDAVTRRKLQRALVNKGALDAQSAGDTKSLGVFLKLMAEDPEVGINAKTAGGGQTTIQILPQIAELQRQARAEMAEAVPLDVKMMEAGARHRLLPAPKRVEKKEAEDDGDE